MTRRAAAVVAGLLFLAVFGIFDFKIAARYLGRGEAAWTDEICVVLFIWIVFWGNALLLRDHEQIRFDLLYAPAGLRMRRLMAVGRHLLVGGLFLWCLPGVVDYLLFLWRERTPVLGLRLDVVYACFLLFMASVVARAGWELAGLLRLGWRERV
jgi:TRAP-type C4-dicarboxylate transport system permease small subunit